MTIRYDRKKLVREMIKGYGKDDELFREGVLGALLEISQRVSALERVLAKKKILHPKEVNTELQKVQKRLVKKIRKEYKK